MCGAIDTTLGAISSGIVHSRVGACDPRGLFAKRVLHDDSHHALAITSLRCLIQESASSRLTGAKQRRNINSPALRRSPRFERLLMRVPSLLVASTLSLFSCVLRAQSTNASLTGRVTDLSRATVAEAKVAAMNTGTTFHYEATTSSSGVPFAFSQRHPCSKVSMSVRYRLEAVEELYERRGCL